MEGRSQAVDKPSLSASGLTHLQRFRYYNWSSYFVTFFRKRGSSKANVPEEDNPN